MTPTHTAEGSGKYSRAARKRPSLVEPCWVPIHLDDLFGHRQQIGLHKRNQYLTRPCFWTTDAQNVVHPRFQQPGDDAQLSLVSIDNSCANKVAPIKFIRFWLRQLAARDADLNAFEDCDIFSLRVPLNTCLLYTSPSPRDKRQSRMPSSA